MKLINMNRLYAQHTSTTSWTSASSFVSCLPLFDKLINPGVPDLSSHSNNNQTPGLTSLSNNGRQETWSWLKFRK